MPIKNVGVLNVCIHDNKVHRVNIEVGIDGLTEFEAQEVPGELLRYLMGELGPEAVIKYLELGSGMLGLVQTAILSIPRGKVATYAQIARLLGTSPRAVGRLAGKNEIPVLIPCHRVVRSDGSLGGYSLGTSVKRALLEFEGVPVVNGRVPRQYLISYERLRENFERLTRLII